MEGRSARALASAEAAGPSDPSNRNQALTHTAVPPVGPHKLQFDQVTDIEGGTGTQTCPANAEIY